MTKDIHFSIVGTPYPTWKMILRRDDFEAKMIIRFVWAIAQNLHIHPKDIYDKVASDIT